MPEAIASPLLTTEDLLAMPDDGVERWLIAGQLREKPMTVRNRIHSRIMVRVSHLLESWLEQQPEPRGAVLCGEAGCRLRRTPDSTVGIDVVYVPAEIAQQPSDETTLIDGVPVLVVEILSPSDTQEEIDDKVDTYIAAGVAVVWIIDPHDRTVLIYRQDEEPILANSRQEISGGDSLPGFRVNVAELFR